LGLRAERPEQVKPILNQAIEYNNGPALVNVVVSRQELLIRSSINLEQISEFTLYIGGLEWPWR
jgi:pyruvate dehydrogenase (quinone)